jgi:hypothetical protein
LSEIVKPGPTVPVSVGTELVLPYPTTAIASEIAAKTAVATAMRRIGIAPPSVVMPANTEGDPVRFDAPVQRALEEWSGDAR